jgi:hypothetical protein
VNHTTASVRSDRLVCNDHTATFGPTPRVRVTLSPAGPETLDVSRRNGPLGGAFGSNFVFCFWRSLGVDLCSLGQEGGRNRCLRVRVATTVSVFFYRFYSPIRFHYHRPPARSMVTERKRGRSVNRMKNQRRCCFLRSLGLVSLLRFVLEDGPRREVLLGRPCFSCQTSSPEERAIWRFAPWTRDSR